MSRRLFLFSFLLRGFVEIAHEAHDILWITLLLNTDSALVPRHCPTLTGHREARKGLQVKSGSPLMKSSVWPPEKLLTGPARDRTPRRLRNYDGDDNKVNSRSVKLHRDYAGLLNLWIVRKLSWRWIIRDGIHVKETKENSLTCDHVPCAEVGKKCTKMCDARTCLVVGGC